MAVSKYEIKCQKELESQGYIVDYKRGFSRWGAKNRDFFNLFDIVAIKKGEPIRWISIKGRQGIPGQHRRDIENFWMPEGNVKEAWARSQSKKKYWSKSIL